MIDNEYHLYEHEDDEAYAIRQLDRLRRALEIELRKKGDGDYVDTDTPLSNSGMRFENDTFHAWAYKWQEPWEYEYTYDEYRALHPDNPPTNDQNFLHNKSGVRMSWYKHFQRGLTVESKEAVDAVQNRTFASIIDDCISSLGIDPSSIPEKGNINE